MSGWRIFFTLLGGIGAVLLIASGGLILLQERASPTSLRAEGKVVNLIIRRLADRSATNFAPLVEFQTESGDTVEFLSSEASNPPTYLIGEQVFVRYDPRYPKLAKIEDLFLQRLLALLLGALGLMLSIICAGFWGIVFIRARRRT